MSTALLLGLVLLATPQDDVAWYQLYDQGVTAIEQGTRPGGQAAPRGGTRQARRRGPQAAHLRRLLRGLHALPLPRHRRPDERRPRQRPGAYDRARPRSPAWPPAPRSGPRCLRPIRILLRTPGPRRTPPVAPTAEPSGFRLFPSQPPRLSDAEYQRLRRQVAMRCGVPDDMPAEPGALVLPLRAGAGAGPPGRPAARRRGAGHVHRPQAAAAAPGPDVRHVVHRLHPVLLDRPRARRARQLGVRRWTPWTPRSSAGEVSERDAGVRRVPGTRGGEPGARKAVTACAARGPHDRIEETRGGRHGFEHATTYITVAAAVCSSRAGRPGADQRQGQRGHPVQLLAPGRAQPRASAAPSWAWPTTPPPRTPTRPA